MAKILEILSLFLAFCKLDAVLKKVFCRKKTRLQKIYIAGRYSEGGRLPYRLRKGNVQKAIIVQRKLMKLGFTPFIPHLSHYADPGDTLGYRLWMEWCFAWLDACDAVLVIDNSAFGVAEELDRAARHGQPIFRNIESLMASRNKLTEK